MRIRAHSRVTQAMELIRVVNQTRQTEIGDRIAVADHGPLRRKGLLGRTGLEAGEGIWIVPCESVHTFGMKFPIDLVYLDRRRRVLKIRADVGAWRLSACLRAHSILELPTGVIAASETQPGDVLEYHSVTAPSADTSAGSGAASAE